MVEASGRNPKSLWVGISISAILLAIFLVLKWAKSPVLDLQPQWLLVALVPILIGLIIGGYVRELKAGDYGVDFAADELLAKSKPIEDGGSAQLKAAALVPVEGWQSDRAKEYARTCGYMLAHIYRRSKQAGQKFDISIFVVRHQKGSLTPPQDKLEEIELAEFFFGDSWGNKVFKVSASEDDGFFGVRTHAWGTFLAACRITFRDADKAPAILYRYIDFSMMADSE
jgi:hypothetical protein